MTEHTILEVKETLSGERKEFQCRHLLHTPDETVILYEIPGTVQVGGLTLPAGTLTLGYFWITRPYNVYHWLSPAGETLGLYFNISEEARITKREITWRDLVVDVLVFPDGHVVVLDEDELPANLDAALREKIAAVRDELVCRHGAIRSEVEARSAGLLKEAGLT